MRYVQSKEGALLVNKKNYAVTELLWGDAVRSRSGDVIDGREPVFTRGQEGWIDPGELGEKGLLEFYFIDVGQGDGVLIRTPDNHWHLVDAGWPGRSQMLKKSAANFLRWKFYSDLGLTGIHLKSLVMSHPDYDHYGGMIDLLRGRLEDGREFDVSVDTLYHCGVGRFGEKPKLGNTIDGVVPDLPNSGYKVGREGTFITELIGDKESFSQPSRPFQKQFKEFADLVDGTCSSAQRLTLKDRYVPGYGPGESDVCMHVLGPVLEEVNGSVPGMRMLGKKPGHLSKSITSNGQSIVMRIDYGNARILLTGDLNAASQRLLLSYVPEHEFAVDVAKGCHHGSEDIDFAFIKAMQARATIISSGDNERYSHPIPSVIGASGKYGREAVSPWGSTLPPQIYSTELARSVDLQYPEALHRCCGEGEGEPIDLESVQVTVPEFSGARRSRQRPLADMPMAIDMIYGLVNVRTDGEEILCAVMQETDKTIVGKKVPQDVFETKRFLAGVTPS